MSLSEKAGQPASALGSTGAQPLGRPRSVRLEDHLPARHRPAGDDVDHGDVVQNGRREDLHRADGKQSCTLVYLPYVDQLSVSEARARLPEVLDRVAEGDEVTITRHGQPVAVVVRPDALRTRRAEATIRHARQIADLLSSAGQQPLACPGLPSQRADELIRMLREARDQS